MAVGLLTITLLLAPFGEGPTDLLQRFDQLRKGLAIGEAQIHPGAVLQALIVLALALLGVKMLKRWLSNRYLPTTELDPGMQLSAVTLFGYAGFVVAVALALSSPGIGLERVAWIASALSVGIGFGLQAIVQNFVSGLILLAERPVQVGDWVSLGGVEGDILRINVRATEIQMSDRSTVIVPNSEFITKTVRNVTRSSPLGLVQIKLPMPLSTDAERARDAILQAFADHADILATPAPNVFLDGLDGGNLIFNAKGYVSSPRAAYGVRSALLFTVLSRLREAGLEVSSPTTVLLAPTPPARTVDAPGLAAPPATS
ncbi:mechanosensitive ion channel domain-containing protein [Achromobacter xylosoxidans]